MDFIVLLVGQNIFQREIQQQLLKRRDNSPVHMHEDPTSKAGRHDRLEFLSQRIHKHVHLVFEFSLWHLSG